MRMYHVVVACGLCVANAMGQHSYDPPQTYDASACAAQSHTERSPRATVLNSGNGSNRVAYVHDSRRSLFTVDMDTGVASFIATTPELLWDIAFDATGNLFGVSSAARLFKVNPTNGSAVAIGYLGYWANALVFDRDGGLWGAGSAVLRINPHTGAATVVVPSLAPYGDSAGDLVTDTSGRIYLSTTSGTLVEVVPGNGTVRAIGMLPMQNMYGLGKGPDGVIYGMTTDNGVYTVNLVTGAASFRFQMAPDFTIGQSYGCSFPSETSRKGTFALRQVTDRSGGGGPCYDCCQIIHRYPIMAPGGTEFVFASTWNRDEAAGQPNTNRNTEVFRYDVASGLYSQETLTDTGISVPTDLADTRMLFTSIP